MFDFGEGDQLRPGVLIPVFQPQGGDPSAVLFLRALGEGRGVGRFARVRVSWFTGRGTLRALFTLSSRNPSPPSILINTVGVSFPVLDLIVGGGFGSFGFFPFFGWFRNHLLKETKHGIQGIAMVKTRFEGVDQSTHDIVGLFSLFGPALGSSSTSSPTLNREVFYPLNFLTGEPFIGLRVSKIVRIFSDVDMIFSLLTHNELILARMKSALVIQNTSLVAYEHARVFFARSSYIPAFPGSKGEVRNLGPVETSFNYAGIPTSFAPRTPKLQHSETGHEINTP